MLFLNKIFSLFIRDFYILTHSWILEKRQPILKSPNLSQNEIQMNVELNYESWHCNYHLLTQSFTLSILPINFVSVWAVFILLCIQFLKSTYLVWYYLIHIVGNVSFGKLILQQFWHWLFFRATAFLFRLRIFDKTYTFSVIATDIGFCRIRLLLQSKSLFNVDV